MFDLTDPIYSDKDKAREHLETLHWPNGPVCPKCGETKRVKRLEGKSTRPGVVMCNACRKPFTVTVGTIFEDSKIPLNKWLLGFRLMAGSKKGISAHQLHRSLGITYKSAWFMAHRIREAMREGGLTPVTPMGGEGKIVEADETYFGKIEGEPRYSRKKYTKPTKGGKVGPGGKRAVVSLVERGGRVRSFHPAIADGARVTEIVRENVARESRLMTDESKLYTKVGKEFASHETTKHAAGEYVRGDVHSNSVEGYFSVFKRGMRGIYQHCGEKHLHRSLAEYDFRFNHRTALGFADGERAALAVKGAAGKRLTYRQPDRAILQA